MAQPALRLALLGAATHMAMKATTKVAADIRKAGR
jgi:hypothetical protein